MPPEPIEPGSPADWLRFARSDLIAADQSPVEGLLLETLCFHAQQAAEKALKAVLLCHNIRFPYTHDIAQLITLIVRAGMPWPRGLDSAADLSGYAVDLRYPPVADDITDEDHQQAVATARDVVEWAESMVSHR